MIVDVIKLEAKNRNQEQEIKQLKEELQCQTTELSNAWQNWRYVEKQRDEFKETIQNVREILQDTMVKGEEAKTYLIAKEILKEKKK